MAQAVNYSRILLNVYHNFNKYILGVLQFSRSYCCKNVFIYFSD